jgi:hypothetical protein
MDNSRKRANAGWFPEIRVEMEPPAGKLYRLRDHRLLRLTLSRRRKQQTHQETVDFHARSRSPHNWSLGRWFDVLVHTEEVCRIILPLDGSKASALQIRW